MGDQSRADEHGASGGSPTPTEAGFALVREALHDADKRRTALRLLRDNMTPAQMAAWQALYVAELTARLNEVSALLSPHWQEHADLSVALHSLNGVIGALHLYPESILSNAERLAGESKEVPDGV